MASRKTYGSTIDTFATVRKQKVDDAEERRIKNLGLFDVSKPEEPSSYQSEADKIITEHQKNMDRMRKADEKQNGKPADDKYE